MHKRDKITVQTDLCSKQQGEQKGKIVSKRFQNYQSLPILQGCWKNSYIILLYICKIGVRIVHIYYTWSSKYLFRRNFKLNVLYPYLDSHSEKFTKYTQIWNIPIQKGFKAKLPPILVLQFPSQIQGHISLNPI